MAYQPAAQVYHSHDYSLLRAFRRYFDIGVFMTQSQEILPGAKSGGEGVRFVLTQLRFLWRKRAWRWIARSIIESLLKFAAFHLGKRSRRLPGAVKRRLSGQPGFWKSST